MALSVHITFSEAFMRYFNNFDAFMKLVLSMTGGFYNTLIIFFFTLLFSLPLGLAVALLRMSRRKIVSVPMSLYILVMRGTPLMLQIFAIYFAIPTLTGVNLDRMNATILAFSINYAAYFAEIFRGGIQSIPVGQREAGQVLGMTRGQTFFHVILPQMAKRVLLPVSNEVITLVKDTSLAFVLGIMEMFTQAKAIAAAQTSMMPYVIAGLIYWVFNFVVVMVINRVEKRMNYYHD